MKKYDVLRLENQICFPLYAAAREIIKRYKPFLDELSLTYTQYIAMMVIWEKRELTAKELGKLLYLDSGTLTPMLKSMESEGLLTRQRMSSDERSLVVTVTEKGMALRDRAIQIPSKMNECVPLSSDEAITLYNILYKILGKGNEAL